MKKDMNYMAFLWHAILLSITATFIEINTVLPAMIIQIGGNEFHIGIMTTIMIGIPLISKLLFAGFLHSRPVKKPYLILGINFRILALTLIAFTIMNISKFSLVVSLTLIFAELLLFTASGAFAGVAYVDIIGKSFTPEIRRSLFLNKQIIASLGILISAVIVRVILGHFGYPVNYFILYLSAAGALLLASGGFYRLKEPVSPKSGKPQSFITTLSSIPGLIKNDANLKNYIIVSNLLSVGTVLLPFYIAFAKFRYSLDVQLVGNLLLVQISGVIISSFIWKRLTRTYGFKGILYILSGISAVLPILAFLFGSYLPVPAYLIVFFFSGTVISAQKVTAEAVLVEISTDESRALYTGIVGTSNITVALLPLIAGALVSATGFLPLFITAGIFPALGSRYIHRLVCPIDKKDESSN